MSPAQDPTTESILAEVRRICGSDGEPRPSAPVVTPAIRSRANTYRALLLDTADLIAMVCKVATPTLAANDARLISEEDYEALSSQADAIRAVLTDVGRDGTTSR